jgi:hypothetical protein
MTIANGLAERIHSVRYDTLARFAGDAHLLTLLWRIDDVTRIIHLTAAMERAHRAAA